MNIDLIEQKSWWKRNWKCLVPVSSTVLILIVIVIPKGIIGIGTDFAQVYSDRELYENALEKVKSNQKVSETLGEIEPFSNLVILEVEDHFT